MKRKNKVAQSMENAIKHRKMQVFKGIFSLSIDATKVAQVLEVSHAHGTIIDVE